MANWEDYMKANHWLLGAVSSAVVIGAIPAASQERQVELRFAYWLPPTHVMDKSIQEWSASIEEASGGSITVTRYPAEQLGSARDHYDIARDGIADLAFVSPDYTPGRFPIFDAAHLPFTISNGVGASSALTEWYSRYAEREMADVRLCLVNTHTPGTLHARKRIELPEDLRGVRVRPAGSITNMIAHLGAIPLQVTAPEAREAIERGLVDAITFPWGSLAVFGIDNAVSYHLDIPLYAPAFAWVMNRGVYDRMSSEQQQVIDDHCNPEWAARAGLNWAQEEEKGMAYIAAKQDHDIIQLTDEQVQLWQEAVAPLVDEWKSTVTAVGHDAGAILDDLHSTLRKHDSKF